MRYDADGLGKRRCWGSLTTVTVRLSTDFPTHSPFKSVTLILMSEVTRLISAVAAGDRRAAADLLPLVYDDLRKLAAAKMVAETPGHSLNPTALVHEAYLRLVGSVDDSLWDSRGHFFAAAAEAMRRILINHARDRNRLKRGGGKHRVDLDKLTDVAAASDNDLLELDDALDRLAKNYSDVAELVKLRLFCRHDAWGSCRRARLVPPNR